MTFDSAAAKISSEVAKISSFVHSFPSTIAHILTFPGPKHSPKPKTVLRSFARLPLESETLQPAFHPVSGGGGGACGAIKMPKKAMYGRAVVFRTFPRANVYQ